ncbi:MAG: hypothetical protein AABW59_05125 [archaeon]
MQKHLTIFSVQHTDDKWNDTMSALNDHLQNGQSVALENVTPARLKMFETINTVRSKMAHKESLNAREREYYTKVMPRVSADPSFAFYMHLYNYLKSKECKMIPMDSKAALRKLATLEKKKTKLFGEVISQNRGKGADAEYERARDFSDLVHVAREELVFKKTISTHKPDAVIIGALHSPALEHYPNSTIIHVSNGPHKDIAQRMVAARKFFAQRKAVRAAKRTAHRRK